MIIAFGLDLCPNAGIEAKAVVCRVCGYGLANLRRRDIVEGRVDHRNALWQRGFINGIAWARIDDEAMVTQDLISLIPLRKTMPVVGSDDEDKLAIGISCAQRFQRMNHVRRTGQVELEIGYTQTAAAAYCQTCQTQARLIIKESRGRLQRVLRRDKKP